MHDQIPIVVTRNGHAAFLCEGEGPKWGHTSTQRAPSVPRPRKLNLEQRHQTMDPDAVPMTSRTRRVSSSAAAKRFPKDFFKDENCLMPIKSSRAKHKQHEPCLLDTFSHKNFKVAVEDCASLENEPAEFDTPKFKHKGQEQKKKGTDFLSQRKIEGVLLTPSGEKSLTNADTQLLRAREDYDKPQPFGQIPFVTNFNLTLGQKNSLIVVQKGKLRKQQASEKENNHCPSSRSSRQEAKGEGGFRIRRRVLG
jgi:hypothetical protein